MAAYVKPNYQRDLDTILKGLEAGGTRPKLLLHACCAPCASYVIEYLSGYFDITVYYYNPNIYPLEEYTRRRDELVRFLKVFPTSIDRGVRLIVEDASHSDFEAAVRVGECPALASEGERGVRCRRCYALRLKRAREYAVLTGGYTWWCTTLSISPYKDAIAINDIGRTLDHDSGDGGALRFLPSDFKKHNGFLRSLALSREYGLYRQDYCGCEYSYRARCETPPCVKET